MSTVAGVKLSGPACVVAAGTCPLLVMLDSQAQLARWLLEPAGWKTGMKIQF